MCYTLTSYSLVLAKSVDGLSYSYGTLMHIVHTHETDQKLPMYVYELWGQHDVPEELHQFILQSMCIQERNPYNDMQGLYDQDNWPGAATLLTKLYY